MKLFFHPGASSFAPHILLREIGEPFDLVKVNATLHRLADGTPLAAINPKEQVPVLELPDGQRLTEQAIIAQFLADRAGRTDLMPAAGSLER